MSLKLLYTTEEAAAAIGYKPSTLETWRYRGRKDGPVPRHRKQGGSVRYHESDLQLFALEDSRRTEMPGVGTSDWTKS